MDAARRRMIPVKTLTEVSSPEGVLDALPMPLMGYANDRLNNALMIPRVPPGDHLQRVDASRLKSVAESLATVRRKSVRLKVPASPNESPVAQVQSLVRDYPHCFAAFPGLPTPGTLTPAPDASNLSASYLPPSVPMPSVLLWPQTDNMGGVLSFPRAMSHFTRGASTDDAVGGNATSHAAKPMPDAAHSCASASQSLDQSIGSEVGFHGAQNTSEGHTSRESMQAPGPLSTSVHRTKGQKRRHADAASGIAGQADLVPATLAMPSVSGDSGATGKSKKKKRKDSVSSYSSPSYEVPSTTAKSPSLSKPTVGFNVPAASSNVHAAPVRRKGSRSKSQDSTETTSSEASSRPAPKRKRKERYVDHDPSHGVNSGFGAVLEDVFEHADRYNLLSVTASADAAISPQLLLPGPILSQVYSNVLKLKSTSHLAEFPEDDLSRLLAVMDKHVLDCLSLQLDVLPDDCDSEPVRWRSLAKDRLLRGLDAALIMLHVSTAQGVSSSIYQEEHMERLIQMISYQLQSTIFPEFDNYYQLSGEKKEGVVVSKMKRGRANTDLHKDIMPVYNKTCEVLTCLAQFVDVHRLPDSVVLLVSSLGIGTFFVENVSSLQLAALHVVRSVFSRYAQHQQIIFSDIFESLSRLPSSKQSLRTYRLTGDARIQMVTALVLQLIESCVCKPLASAVQIKEQSDTKCLEEGFDGSASMEERKLVIMKAFDSSRQCALTFLTSFLKRCHSKEENDYRPLFENFVQDLLVCLYSAEWPAAQVLVEVLLPLLAGASGSKSAEVSLRVAALDHLGSIAAKLRKQDLETDITEPLQQLVSEIRAKLTEDGHAAQDDKDDTLLRRAFIEQLHQKAAIDQACRVAKEYHLASWLCRSYDKQHAILTLPDGVDSSDLTADSTESLLAQTQELEKYCDFLYSLAAATEEGKRLKRITPEISDEQLDMIVQHLCSVSQRSFKYCLLRILMDLGESLATVRTKAMKALSVVVNADPALLGQTDVQSAVHASIKDPSTSMREATVDLIGKFVLLRPELTLRYYPVLSERISDAGVSVRKRVIKTMRDICVQQPEFQYVPHICLLMIRCLKEEDSSKALVRKVFEEMWFSPFSSEELAAAESGSDDSGVLLRVKNIVKAVAISTKDTHEWIEALLKKMLRVGEEDEKEKSSATAATRAVCQTMVDCLVKHMLVLEETPSDTSKSYRGPVSDQLLSCICTLCLFVRADARLAVSHPTHILPYLDMPWDSQHSSQLSCYVSEILLVTIPLISHPSETFLANLEERLVEIMFSAPQAPVISAVGCLATIVNKITHNHKIIHDSFKKFYDYLYNKRNQPAALSQPNCRSLSLRSVLCVGVLCRYFDDGQVLDSTGDSGGVTERVFRLLMGLVQKADGSFRIKSLAALGYFFMGHPEMMIRKQCEDMYTALLQPTSSVDLTLQVLKNIGLYLAEDEVRMAKQSEKKKAEKKLKAIKKHQSQENGEEAEDKDKLMNWDSQSHVSSSIAQVFLKSITRCMLHKVKEVRSAALHVIGLVFNHGLVHPYEFVPHLIAMNADVAEDVRLNARRQLVEFDKKNPGFLSTVAYRGFQKAFELRFIVSQQNPAVMRGQDPDKKNALLSHMYLLVRGNRQQRRGFILSLLRVFQDSKTSGNLPLLLFTADNLAGFPYSLLDEPLFIIHHLTKISSLTASDAIQHFKETMGLGSKQDDDDDWLDFNFLKGRREGKLEKLRACHAAGKGAMLLLFLKEHLKELYGLSDGKCRQYAPSEKIKGPEKPSNPKSGIVFNPSTVVSIVTEPDGPEAHVNRDEILRQFIELHQIMSSIDRAEDDPDDVNEDEDAGKLPVSATPMDVNGPDTVELVASASSASALPAPVGQHGRVSRPDSSGSRKGASKKKRKHDSASDSDAQSVKSSSSRTTTRRRRRRVIASSDSESDNDDVDKNYVP